MHIKLEAYTKIFHFVNPNEPTVYKQGNTYVYISLDIDSSYYWKFGRNGAVLLSLWVFYFQNLLDIKESDRLITKFDYLRAKFFIYFSSWNNVDITFINLASIGYCRQLSCFFLCTYHWFIPGFQKLSIRLPCKMCCHCDISKGSETVTAAFSFLQYNSLKIPDDLQSLTMWKIGIKSSVVMLIFVAVYYHYINK